ncbi:MAG: NAD/NADP octopine/nopaline dehydrogenase family protein [Planctomycetota bacterium]
MRIANILSPQTIVTNLSAANRETAVGELVSLVARARGLDDPGGIAKDVLARENANPTVIPVGPYHVVLPHAFGRPSAQLMMALGVSRQGVPWVGERRANLVVLLLGPAQTQLLYLRVLSRVAKLLGTQEALESFLAATSPEDLISRVAAAEEPLGEIVPHEGLPTVCVLGAGHGGKAMAGHLALLGCKVNLWNRTPERIQPIRDRGGVDLSGAVEGFASLNLATADPGDAVDNMDILMVVVPASGHRDVAQAIAPHVKDGQIIILNPGRTGGALEVAQVLRQVNTSARCYVAEAQTLLYACRSTNPGQVHIYSIKNSVPLAVLPGYYVVDVLPVVQKVLPQFVPCESVLKTSLSNIGAVFHPAITILNTARIEDTHGDFQYYVEGVTPAVAAVLEAVDRERVSVAAALGVDANSAREWLYLAYDAAGKTLFDAMRANRGYFGIKAPGTVQHRYISEDVPFSLVPIASIGRMFGVPTPAIDSIIHLASAMHKVDYWAQGRTVERLGIAGMSVKEIRFLVLGAELGAARSDGRAEGQR